MTKSLEEQVEEFKKKNYFGICAGETTHRNEVEKKMLLHLEQALLTAQQREREALTKYLESELAKVPPEEDIRERGKPTHPLRAAIAYLIMSAPNN